MSHKVVVLNVAEKPSVARAIANALANGKYNRRNGLNKSNHIFEFDYKIENQACRMMVTSVLGHLQSYSLPAEYDNWDINPIKLFDAPLFKKTLDSMIPIQNTLQREAKKAKWLVLWLDCDREGENIAFEVIRICHKINPNLRILRSRFSALSLRDIQRALQTLSSPNELESDAVDARQELDLRIGFAFTRLQTVRWRRRFEKLSQLKLISYGPCQFPTLGFVVDRYWQNFCFVPELYWTLKLDLTSKGISTQFKWQRERIYDHLSCLILYQFCLKLGQWATIVDIHEKKAQKARPLPLTTVVMQKTISRIFHIPGHRVMESAEHLYQLGLISYPRTDTDSFPEGFDYQEYLSQQKHNPKWGEYATSLLERDAMFCPPRAGSHNDQAHLPIYPVIGKENMSKPPSLKFEEEVIYEFVVRHFLATVSQDAIGSTTEVKAAFGDELFKCQGLVIKALNFLEIYSPYSSWKDNQIAPFQKGQKIKPNFLNMIEKQTKAPPLLTEADLISLMYTHGIGTDATIAELIDTVLRREYMTKNNKMQLIPTKLGEALVAGYNLIGQRHLNQPRMRAAMEAQLQKIAAGTIKKGRMIDETLKTYRDIFAQVLSNVMLLDQALSRYFQPLENKDYSNFKVSQCGKCDNVMTFKKVNGEQFLYCASCQEQYSLPSGKIKGLVNTFCRTCKYQMVEITSYQGESQCMCPNCFNASSTMSHTKKWSSEKKSPEHQLNPPLNQSTFGKQFNSIFSDVFPCPACKEPMRFVENQKTKKRFIRCSAFPTCSKILWLPSEEIDHVNVSKEQCKTCKMKPSYLVTFIYTKRAALEYSTSSVTGCLGGCNPIIKEWLALCNNGFQGWCSSSSSEFDQITFPSSSTAKDHKPIKRTAIENHHPHTNGPNYSYKIPVKDDGSPNEYQQDSNLYWTSNFKRPDQMLKFNLDSGSSRHYQDESQSIQKRIDQNVHLQDDMNIIEIMDQQNSNYDDWAEVDKQINDIEESRTQETLDLAGGETFQGHQFLKDAEFYPQSPHSGERSMPRKQLIRGHNGLEVKNLAPSTLSISTLTNPSNSSWHKSSNTSPSWDEGHIHKTNPNFLMTLKSGLNLSKPDQSNIPNSTKKWQGDSSSATLSQKKRYYSEINERKFCNCDELASYKVSKTKNSKGRQFYVCETGQCEFFEWAADEVT